MPTLVLPASAERRPIAPLHGEPPRLAPRR